MTSGHPDSATAHRTGRFSAPLPRTALGLVALLALLAGCTSRRSVASGTPATAPTASPGTGALAIQSAYENVIRGALPSVVQITTGQALGSGIVLDDRGDIVTNAHVVSSATQFQVTYADSTAPHPATLVGTYLPDDLAVIRVQNPGRVHPATFADASKLQVGQLVMALGNPL